MMPIGRYYWELVMRRWKPLLAIVTVCTLVAWLVTALLLVQFPKFEGNAKLNIVPTSEELGYASRFVRGSTFDGGSVLLQTYGEYAHTRPIVAPIVDRYIRESAKAAGQTVDKWSADHAVPSVFAPGPWISLLQYGPTPPRPPREVLIDKLVQNTTLATIEGTYLLQVTVDWSDPDSAAWLTNQLADSIVDQADAMSHQTGSQIAGGLVARLAQTRATLDQKLRQSRALKNQLGVVDIDRQKQALLEEQLAQQAQLTTDRSDLSASRARVADLEQRAKGKLSMAQLQVQQTLAAEGPRLDGLARGIPVREARIGAIIGQLGMLGRNEQAVKQLDDEIDILQTEAKALDERVSFSQNENLANAPRIKLIEHAVPPPVRTSPKTLFNTVLGFLGGCAIAGCWLLLFDLGETATVTARAVEPEDEANVAEEPVVAAEPELPYAAPAVHAAPPEHHFEPEPEPEPEPVGVVHPVVEASAPIAEDNADIAVLDHAEPEMPLPLPLAIDSEAAPRPLARGVAKSDDRIFTGRLPRPANGNAYRADEIEAFGARLVQWLAGPLARPGRPLIVAATGEDRDAQMLYRLLHDHLRATDMPVRTIDGTARSLAAPDAPSDTLALVYAGGFAGTAQLELLARSEAEIVVAVSATGEQMRGVLAEFQESVAGIAGRVPYVVALGR